MVGRATLTIVRSTTVMKNETASSEKARQRRTSARPRPMAGATDVWDMSVTPFCSGKALTCHAGFSRCLIAFTCTDPGDRQNSPHGASFTPTGVRAARSGALQRVRDGRSGWGATGRGVGPESVAVTVLDRAAVSAYLKPL